jgi:hypothetical protein
MSNHRERHSAKAAPRAPGLAPSVTSAEAPLTFRRASSWVALVAPLCAALLAAEGGCSSSGTGAAAAGPGSSSASSGQGGAGGSGPELTGRDIFEAIKPAILEECGSCHKNGGISESPFLGQAGFEYETITSWPGIVVATPSQSIMITHPADPNHGAGQAPNISEELRAKVLEWLEFEADNLPVPEGPMVFIDPFKPILKGALNTIYLDPFGPEFEYNSISFNAEELGDPPSMLLLSDIEVHPIAGATIHVVHPLFTVYPLLQAPSPDPIDNFSNVDQTFSLDSPDLALGTGAAVLTNWQKDARLGLAFELIEGKTDEGPVTTCKNVNSFKTNVVPQMQYCAETCHGGKNADANATMDLSKLNDAVPNEACSQVRARITPGDPDKSQIFIVTNPKDQAVHMYKFKGNVANYNAFKAAVSPWVMDEL